MFVNEMKLLLEYDNQHSSISDPWYSNRFDETYKDVVTGCTAFLKYLENEGKIWKLLFVKKKYNNINKGKKNTRYCISLFTIGRNPDFCRKISIKYPSNQINTRSGGFVIVSDFHGVLALELGVWKIFFAIGYCTIIPSSCSYHIC